jgi:MFS family permease
VLRLADRLRRGGDPAYGWAIVATFGITETVSYGVLTYAFAVLLVPMQHATGWPAAAITGAYSLALLVSGLAGLRVGRLLDHRSPRLLMTAGSALAAVLVLTWSRASSLFELYLVFAGLGVAMALVLYEPAFIVVTTWFHVGQRAALTTLTLIAAWASFIFSPLTERLVADYGWRDATAILALVLAVITVPLHALVLRPAPRRNESATAPEGPTRRAVSRRGAFWLIVASFAFSSFVSVATVVHLVALLIAGGITPAFAAFAAGLMGLAQIPGRVLFAVVGRGLDPAALATAVFGLGSAALLLLAVTHARWAVIAFVVCFGMSNGMMTLLKATLVADLYGRRSYGAIAGLIGSFTIAAEAAAPFAAALIALAPGGYTTMLVVLAAAAATAALVARRGVQLELAPRALPQTVDDGQPDRTRQHPYAAGS